MKSRAESEQKSGYAAILLAAKRGDVGKIRALLDGAAPVLYAIDSAVTNALFDAAERGHVECVREMLSRGVNPVRKYPRGETLLMASVGSPECVALALAAGVDVDARTIDGMSAFDIAIMNGCARAIPLLIRAGATWPEGALLFAVRSGRAEYVKALIAAGADISARDHVGTTPLISAVARGHLQMVRALLKANADVNHADKNGWTAAKAAFLTGRTQMLDLLLKAGADLPDMDFVLEIIRSKRDSRASQAECLVFMVKKGVIDPDKIMGRLRRYKGGVAHQALAMIESETLAKLSGESRAERCRRNYAHV